MDEARAIGPLGGGAEQSFSQLPLVLALPQKLILQLRWYLNSFITNDRD